MHKEKVYIFGDSYANSSNNRRHNFYEYSWPRKLEKAFDVTNFAVGGCGPQHVCMDLHDLITLSDKNQLKESIAIIVLPDVRRYNFSFYKKKSHSVFGQINSYHPINHYFSNEFLKLYDQEKLDFIVKFNEYYLDTPINIVLEVTKYLSYFNTIADCFKQTLVWPVNYTVIEYQYKNIDIVSVDLETIEKHDYAGNVGFGLDNRMNHVSLENHAIITEQLYNWIVNRTPIEDRFLKG